MYNIASAIYKGHSSVECLVYFPSRHTGGFAGNVQLLFMHPKSCLVKRFMAKLLNTHQMSILESIHINTVGNVLSERKE